MLFLPWIPRVFSLGTEFDALRHNEQLQPAGASTYLFRVEFFKCDKNCLNENTLER